MDIANAAIVQGATSLAQRAIHDTTASDLISKTIDSLNSVPASAGSGAALNANYQFQKDVLSAAGIGNKLDAIV
ncbi:MAG: hypothetical protein LBN33_02290 [Desulfovibrio sp.]|jgi:hypothetical protein|nr:hypothetical protein [Desulfovibrio sp.]